MVESPPFEHPPLAESPPARLSAFLLAAFWGNKQLKLNCKYSFKAMMCWKSVLKIPLKGGESRNIDIEGGFDRADVSDVSVNNGKAGVHSGDICFVNPF